MVCALQVLRILVEATGLASRLCNPREMVVERLVKREDDGVVVVLFSSIDKVSGLAAAARLVQYILTSLTYCVSCSTLGTMHNNSSCLLHT